MGGLLAEQIETADMVLLNKADLASAAELRAAEAVIAGVNADAQLLSSSFGNVEPALLLPARTARQSHLPPEASAPRGKELSSHSHAESHEHSHCQDSGGHGHAHSHGHSHGHSHAPSPQEKYGIHSFVYKARRPFNAARFATFMK